MRIHHSSPSPGRMPARSGAALVRRHAEPTGSGAARRVLVLQRTAGNHAVAALLRSAVAPVGVQRQTAGTRVSTRGLDAQAAAIVTNAANTSRPVSQRAVELVWAIIRAYFPSKAGLVRAVQFDDSETGLSTTVRTAANAQGTRSVGSTFLNEALTGFARRPLQVGHELEHVEQHRSGMGGPATKHLREFLAFYHKALAPELAGTGRVSHSTRVRLIDAALGNHYCLSTQLRTTHAAKEQELLAARARHDGRASNPSTTPPSSCQPSG